MLNLDTLGLAAKITASGITAPDYPTILERLTGYFRQIYGEDAYLEPDSKDGQMLAIYALALHDANNMVIESYNTYSPRTSSGAALSNNVAINGLSRHAATRSTADVTLVGQVGTVVKNGLVRDRNNNPWALPDIVTIGTQGTVTVTATCQKLGAITAAPGDIYIIGTPTRGWQSVTNSHSATAGAPIEPDGALRIRQHKSVALPSRTVLDGMHGAISLIPGVVRLRGFENDTHKTDVNGIPPHSVAMIVDGGDATEIAKTIALKKTPGSGTFGDTTINVRNHYGLSTPVRFSRPVDVSVYVELNITAFEGYTTLVGDRIKTAIAKYINTIVIGDNVYLARLYSPANLPGDEEGKTYDINSLKIGRSAHALAESNLKIAFNEAPVCNIDNINVVVT
ncbi:baseplate J/gp47 family protein [Xenorhabdus bovienii]|uniref:baseplate J/gp47 family protein n=1 Tax=Xenorhabdus bovienii TaxID=40576 RepID=UPI001EE0DE32|nr:baseplate J/gp47 family protein [Xenorhabdus bovienii]MCG3461554.1 baseplate J/gp47 family protein [Xenorhabdus bovienii]